MKPDSTLAAAQCAANIDAVLRLCKVPTFSSSAGSFDTICLADISRMVERAPDRCRYIEYCPWAEPPKVLLRGGGGGSGSIRTSFGVFYDALQYGLTPETFGRDDLFIQTFHGPTARISWRQKVQTLRMPSLQITKHEKQDGGTEYEIDFDRLLVKRDLASFLGHWFGEVVWHRLTGRKTNPFKIRGQLIRCGIQVVDVRDPALVGT